jgi:hypothetical protein
VNHVKGFEGGLSKMTESWQKAVSSWETRVKPQLEKARSMGGNLKETPELERVESGKLVCYDKESLQ